MPRVFIAYGQGDRTDKTGAAAKWPHCFTDWLTDSNFQSREPCTSAKL